MTTNPNAISRMGEPSNQIAVIGDRKVLVAGRNLSRHAGEEPSLYTLCRQWFQNNPYNVPPSRSKEKAPLPPIKKQDMPEKTSFKGSLVSSDCTDPTSLEAHKQRWKADGEHRRRVALANRKPYIDRLVSIISQDD